VASSSGEQSSAVTIREHALADTFVTLADTLVADYDVVDLMQHLVDVSVSLLGAQAAGLLLVDQPGGLTVVASSSEESRLLEVFQLQNNQGPCLDCVTTSTAVSCGDLVAETDRWPMFAQAAADAGFRSVVALPLRLRSEVVGGLNLFYTRSQQIPSVDQRIGQAFADVATIGILQQRAMHRGALLAEQLQRALNSRVTIEQAKGVLAERLGVGVGQAFSALRLHARNHNMRLTDVAMGVVRGELDIGPA